MTTVRASRGFRFPAEVILWAVRWSLQFPLSYRDLEAMLADRGGAGSRPSARRSRQSGCPSSRSPWQLAHWAA